MPFSPYNPPPAGGDILSPYQFWFQGKVFGEGTNGVNIKEFDGLDIEDMRTGDAVQPRDQGEYPGYDFLKGRDITIKFDMQGINNNDLFSNFVTLGSCMTPQANQETTFFINLPYFNGAQMGTVPGLGPQNSGDWGSQPYYLNASCRPRNKSWKLDTVFSLGSLAQDNTMQFHTTDPRFYSPTVQYMSSGHSPLTMYPYNVGNYDCRPIIQLQQITGNVETIQFINASTYLSGNQSVAFASPGGDLYGAASTTLNMYAHTSAYVYPGYPAVPYNYNLTGNPEWWTMQPGQNKIVCSWTGGGIASMTLTWASAWLL